MILLSQCLSVRNFRGGFAILISGWFFFAINYMKWGNETLYCWIHSITWEEYEFENDRLWFCAFNMNLYNWIERKLLSKLDGCSHPYRNILDFFRLRCCKPVSLSFFSPKPILASPRCINVKRDRCKIQKHTLLFHLIIYKCYYNISYLIIWQIWIKNVFEVCKL